MSAIKTVQITVPKNNQDLQITNITAQVLQAVADSRVKEGIANVFVLGSTASITTMQYEPATEDDLQDALEKMAPSDEDYKHNKAMRDGNGKSHVKAAFLGPGITVPIKARKVLLGRWQQIVLLDLDVPQRDRTVVITILGEWL